MVNGFDEQDARYSFVGRDLDPYGNAGTEDAVHEQLCRAVGRSDEHLTGGTSDYLAPRQAHELGLRCDDDVGRTPE